MCPVDGTGASDERGTREASQGGGLGARRDAGLANDAGARQRLPCRAPRHVPLTHDDRGAWNERDEALLKGILHARARCDLRAMRAIAGELLRPYLPGLHAFVARRTAWLRLQPRDREEIVSAAVERLLGDLTRDPDLKGAPFGAVAATKASDAIVDFVRARHRRVCEILTAPEELPEVAAADEAPLVEQTAAASALLEPLRQHEREIVYERYVLDFDARDVAGRHDMSIAAVRMACSRSRRRIRDAVQNGDVTFSDPPSVSGGEGSLEEEARSGGFPGGASQGNNPDPHDQRGMRESEA